MKRKVKKLALVMAMLMVFALIFSGCGSSKDSASTSTTASTSALETSAAQEELKPVKLSFYYWDTPQKDLLLVQDAMNKYLAEKKLNCELTLYPTDPSTYTQKINILLSSGEPADLVFTASWLGYVAQAQRNAFYPLDELLEKYGQGIIENIQDGYIEAAKVNGKLFAIPSSKDQGMDWGIGMLKEVTDKYGIDPNSFKTLEDMEPLLQKIKKDPNSGYKTPLYLTKNHSLIWGESTKEGLQEGFCDLSRFVPTEAVLPNLGAASAYIYYDIVDNKAVSYFDTKESMAFFKLMRKWYQAGYINKDAATTQQNANDVFKQNKTWHISSSISPGGEEQLATLSGKEVKLVKFLSGMKSTFTLTGAVTAVGKNSVDPARAMMVINLLHSDKDFYNLYASGIEGKHYVKVDDTYIKLPDGVKNWSDTGYLSGSYWENGNYLFMYLKEGVDLPDRGRKMAEFNKNLKKSPLLGFTFNFDPIATERVAVENALNEYMPLLITGSIDPETAVPKLVEKLKNAGLDKIIGEYQNQVDAWKAQSK